MTREELVALKSRIDTLQIVYAALFGASLLIIVLQRTVATFGAATTLGWAMTLGGAVATRLYRTSLINKYNAELAKNANAPIQ